MAAIWTRLLKKFFGRKPKEIFPGHKHVITEAFELEGVKYYMFDDQHNLPSQRALTTYTFYNEVSQRVDREFLIRYTKAIDDILRSQKVDIYKIQQLNAFLADRLNWIVDADTIYKLASVVYFDENESPYDYDATYNAKKIEKWKKSMKASDFFYSAPILTLVPFLKDFQGNLEEYLMVAALTKEQILTNILPTS